MQVLLSLERGAGPMSLTQLATQSGMQPSKVHRYLVSLGRVGLVTQSATSGLYDLGPSLRRLGAEALRRMDEVGIASDYLSGLRDRTGHAVNMAVWGDAGPVVIRWDYGAHVLPITVRVGATLPLLSSSVGRVYLAILPEIVTRPLVTQRSGDQSHLTAEEIDRIRAEVRRDGYATTAGGVIPGIFSLAAPVYTTGDVLPLVVSIAVPERLALPKTLKSLTAELLSTTRVMSEALGWTET
jgi:DNA-binding IclR family transcriptional regulator